LLRTVDICVLPSGRIIRHVILESWAWHSFDRCAAPGPASLVENGVNGMLTP